MIISKRALIFAILAYIATFIAAIVFTVAFGIDPAQLATSPPLNYCVAIIISSTIISIVAAYLYFTYKNPPIKATLKEGFKFGILLIVLGFILDMVFILPMVINSGGLQQMISSYSKLYVYFVFVGALVGTSGVGYWLQKKS